MNDSDIQQETNQSCPLFAIAKQQLEAKASWIEIWTCYAESPLFTDFVRDIAARLLRKYAIPLEWRQDIEQESAVYFASLLQRKPDLGYDSNLGAFRSWLYVILNGCCLKAIRQFKDSLRQRSENQLGKLEKAYSCDMDMRLDISTSIEQLPENLRSPLLEYLRGQSVNQISETLGIGQRTIYRRVNLAIQNLRRILSGDC